MPEPKTIEAKTLNWTVIAAIAGILAVVVALVAYLVKPEEFISTITAFLKWLIRPIPVPIILTVTIPILIWVTAIKYAQRAWAIERMGIEEQIELLENSNRNKSREAAEIALQDKQQADEFHRKPYHVDEDQNVRWETRHGNLVRIPVCELHQINMSDQLVRKTYEHYEVWKCPEDGCKVTCEHINGPQSEKFFALIKDKINARLRQYGHNPIVTSINIYQL